MPPKQHKPGEAIYNGAEATLTAALHLGRLAVVKQRRPKAYRIKELEASIAGTRMRNEARLLRRAREAGVGAPSILDADPEAQSITLEYLGPSSLRSVYGRLPARERRAAATAMGAAVGRLHKAAVIHGDLTTSNMLQQGEELCLVDFSLGHISEKLEDCAVDLKAFKDSFVATHVEHAADFAFVLKAYSEALGPQGKKVIAHITSIERRRRYA